MADEDELVREGALITDRVRLLRPLRDGGMGSVWVAEHLTLRTEVAVKFVSAERMADNPEAVVRFMGEASAAAQIQSPHVVRTFDHGVTDDGVPFIVMELLEGETLRERLRRAGAMAPLDVAVMLRQLCRALSAAHRSGIIHRDIKPDNLFLMDVHVDPDDSGAFADNLFLKVLDFGLAKRVDLSYSLETSTGAMVGTPAYMSPEQALSTAKPDPRADLWAAAVVAFHALTGEVPFRGETLGSLCVNIAQGSFATPSSLREGLPTSVDRFFERALATDPEERFQTAGQLAREFLEAVKLEDHLPPLLIRSAASRAASSADLSPVPTLGGSSVMTERVAPRAPWRRAALPLAAALALGGLAALSMSRSAEPDPAAAASEASAEPQPTSEPEPDPPKRDADDSHDEDATKADDAEPQAKEPPSEEPPQADAPPVSPPKPRAKKPPKPDVADPPASPPKPAPVREWAF